ncbi:MAG: hypothetical protein DRJ01_13615 [Bacteroidetes bacterium]|nr:MAG: hypothetical protein DRJ01_13615 [Bacteroidota bacterium]
MMKKILFSIIFLSILFISSTYADPLIFVKEYNFLGKAFNLDSYSTIISSTELLNEKLLLDDALNKLNLKNKKNGVLFSLKLADIEFPLEQKIYKERIYNQAYHLRITNKEILIEAPSKIGVFYGVQSFLQILNSYSKLPEVDIKDCPDLPMRMIMVDPARQNENFDYYRRLIKFCGKNKINFIQFHLTDHQTSVYNFREMHAFHQKILKNI